MKRYQPQVERDLLALGGFAHRSELFDRGTTRTELDVALSYGRSMFRARKGWYASFEAPRNVVVAWRAAGRLACVSAAEYYGFRPATGGPVHVSVPRNASRLTAADDVILHWDEEVGMRDVAPRDRAAVPLDRALEQMRQCRATDSL